MLFVKFRYYVSSFVLFCGIFVKCFANPVMSVEGVGDILQFVIPTYAFGMTMQEKDYTGAIQLSKALLLTQTTTILLKEIVPERRPDKSYGYKSFPSGHSAFSFSAATFIHKRYGLKMAILPYIAATYVGFSRIHAKRHYPHDVLAGAVISAIFSYFLVDKYNIIFNAHRDGVGIAFKIDF